MHTNVTIAGLWRPEERSWAFAYDVVLVLVGTLLIALSAQIAIGFPVPISAQTFAVVLIGALLFVVSNLLTDICYALADPRVKLK